MTVIRKEEKMMPTFYVDPVSRQSRNVGQAGRLTLVDVVVGDYKMDIPLGILVAVLSSFQRFTLYLT